MFSITTPFGDTTFRFVERARLSRAVPGLRRARHAARRRQPLRLRAHRSRHLQLPDHEAGAALDGARARLRALLGDRSSTPATSRADAAARARLGAEVGRDVGSALAA